MRQRNEKSMSNHFSRHFGFSFARLSIKERFCRFGGSRVSDKLANWLAGSTWMDFVWIGHSASIAIGSIHGMILSRCIGMSEDETK